MEKLKEIMIGKKENSNKLLFCVIAFMVFSHIVYGQKQKSLEQKALDYFCALNLNNKISNNYIRFKGKTTGRSSRVYQVANCMKYINFMRDSISNSFELDSINKLNRSKPTNVIPLDLPENCTYLKRKICAPFKKRIYTLHVLNACLYKDDYYVELFFINKNQESWVVCVRFNENEEPYEYCMSYLIF